jgi:hypothetical protein
VVLVLSAACRHIFSRKGAGSHASSGQQAAAAPAAGSMDISLHAVGAAVYLIDAHTAAERQPMQETASGRTSPAAAGISIPTSSEPRQRPGSADSSSRGCSGCGAAEEGDGDADELRQPAESVKAAEGDTEDGARRSAEMLRMLGLYLDLGLEVHIQVR